MKIKSDEKKSTKRDDRRRGWNRRIVLSSSSFCVVVLCLFVYSLEIGRKGGGVTCVLYVLTVAEHSQSSWWWHGHRRGRWDIKIRISLNRLSE